MKLKEITVSYGGTQSLPEYSNTKVALTLTATLDTGDDPQAVEAQLWDMAKQAVHAQIDLALEANDKAAKYDPAPRYQVVMTYWDRYGQPKEREEPPKIVVILPNEMTLDRRADVHFVSPGYMETRKLRYAHALRIAVSTARERDADLIDCADGDLSRLAAVLPPAVSEEPPGRTAPEHLEDTLDYSEQDPESEWERKAIDDGPDNSM